MKTCIGCGETKPATEFYTERRGNRIYTRPRCKPCQLAENERYAAGKPRKRPPRERRLLPPGPFADWLRGLREQEEERQRIHAFWRGRGVTDNPVERVAERTGVPDYAIRAFLRGDRGSVHIDTVDAALLREGSTLLQELYPELYAFDDETTIKEAA